ncbi:TMV resistance protein N-like isoform X2 [Lotus japonicus]|nr:TMV resistance protein N-like isoform X2 [Lotus japonicus]
MLEIYGAGGIGKTTFALDIYNKIRHQFEASSFLANIREKSSKSKGLEDLQKTLMSEMGEETETMMGSTFRGDFEIKRRLSNKRVLLVLDDVDKIKQLQALAGGGDWFGSGSRIIITTRDTTMLDKHKMDDVIMKKYKMEELNDHDSLELFCWHAFNMSTPAENFEGVSSHAVSYAKGVPLALKVIGSNLKGGRLEDWEIELNKYRTIPNSEIQGVLEISYFSLSELDQKTFLDIACFFKGERWVYVERVLEACDSFPSIRVFVMKSLINIDENGCLDMHDIIQNMGREIVRKESPLNLGDRSRLWSHKEVLQVLKENSGSATVEGIILDPPSHEEVFRWADTAFKKMENLRILIVRNATFSTAPSFLPNNLRVLDWKGYPSKSFPLDFCPQRIVDFKLPHSSLTLIKSFHEMFEDLTFINLSQCQFITQIPKLSGAKSLRVLTVDRCHKLIRFDESIGFMPNLEYLSAVECTSLKSFVPRMYLPALEVLSFNLCRRLEHFPDVMQKMDKPLKIHMIGTAIKKFPKSIGNLTGLEYIDISMSRRLSDLSSSFLLLPKLGTLRIDGCSQLRGSFQRFKEFHSEANDCPNMVTLYLSDANLSDEDLHIILESFPKLEHLNVSHNNFASLPKCIKGSLHLKSLDVSYCRNLKEIPELPLSIQKVDARYCGSLTSKASSMLWSKVCEEKKEIQVVMPKTKIPNWFDISCVSNEDVPLFWARRKFPVAALALVFGNSREINVIQKDTFISDFLPGMMTDMSHVVGLHLFIDGQEICRKDYHYCSVGEHHVLVCDLRILFSDEEWQGLDACLGDDWKAIQVQCESSLTLSSWGVYVYKQKSNTDDIQFKFSHPDSSGDYKPVPASSLVPKSTPQMLKQRIRYASENMNPREIFGDYLPFLEIEETPSFTKALLRSWRIAKTDMREASASAYGASLMQEHEESGWDVVRVVELMKENVPKHIADSYSDDIQSAHKIVEQVLRARVEFQREKGNERLDIDMPIILEACHFCEASSRRYWGKLELKHEEPTVKAILRKTSQLAWRFWKMGEAPLKERMNIVLLESQCESLSTEEASTSAHGEEEEEEYYDPVLEELLMKVEEDTMSLNRTYGKLKASIVLCTNEELVSDKYLLETLFLRGQQNLAQGNTGLGNFELGLFGMFGSGLRGTMRSNFKKTAYGRLRVEDDGPHQTAQSQNVNQDQVLHEVRDAQNQNQGIQHDLRDAQNQNQGIQHDLRGAQSQSTQNQNKLGCTDVLMRWILCCCTTKSHES